MGLGKRPGKRLALWVAGGIVLLCGVLWRVTADDSGVMFRASVRSGLHSGPLALAVDGQMGRVFVATTSATTRAGQLIGNGSVVILDAQRGNRLGRVAVGGSGNAVSVDEATHRAFVATTILPGYTSTYVGRVVHLLDTRTGAVLRTIGVGNAPVDIAVDEQTGHAFVATLGPVNRGGSPLGPGRIVMLDARTGAPLHTVMVGAFPRGLAVARTTGRVFVPNADSKSVSLLNARTGALVRTIPLGLMPCDSGADLPCTAAAIDERTRRVFVVGDSGPQSFTGGVRMLDARSGAVLRRLTVRGRPYAVAVDARRGHVFVANLGDATINGTVLMLDARTGALLHTIPVGGTPLALAVDERTGRAIVLGTNGGVHAFLNRSGLSSEFTTDTVSVLDTRTGAILRTITVGGDLRAVVVDARTNHAFVADYAGGSVSMISLAR